VQETEGIAGSQRASFFRIDNIVRHRCDFCGMVGGRRNALKGRMVAIVTPE